MTSNKEFKVFALPMGQDPSRLGIYEWAVMGDYPDGIRTVNELVLAMTHGEITLTDNVTIKELVEIITTTNGGLSKTIPELCDSWLRKHEFSEKQFRLFAVQMDFGNDTTRPAKDMSFSIRDIGELRFVSDTACDQLGSVMYVYQGQLLAVFHVLDLENGIVLSVEEMVSGIKNTPRRARIHRLLVDGHLASVVDGFPCRSDTTFRPSDLVEVVVVNVGGILDMYLATLALGNPIPLTATIMARVLESASTIKGLEPDFIELADLADTCALLFYVHHAPKD